MDGHNNRIALQLKTIKEMLFLNSLLKQDIDFGLTFIGPYSGATNVQDVKLIFIGQDPTVRRKDARKEVNVTLNLDKENSLQKYLKKVCDQLGIDIQTEVYATNLYKCFFNHPPADDQALMSRHFKVWMDFLRDELKVFENPLIITLGEPLLNQLIHTGQKKMNYYWDYVGQTSSGCRFKCSEPYENYLQRRIYPIAHQPAWSRNVFYKKYLGDYLAFIKENEKHVLSN